MDNNSVIKIYIKKLIWYFSTGMSALAFAAENGHIKCEKRIWLFNWNMDVLKEMELSKSKSEDEKDKDSLYSTAERYKQQYER